MVDRLHHRAWHYALLLVIGSMLFLLNLGGASLWDLDEGRNATCTQEMLASGNFIVPTFNGQLRVDKPALIYWLQALAYHTLGINEFAARLPSALAALLTLLLCYELGRALFDKTTGLLAGLIVGSTPMLCGAARFANPDALLNCFVVLTMLVFWLGHHRPTWAWYVALGMATGLAVLAKGPVGLVLPGTALGIYCLWTGRLHLWCRPALLTGILAFLLVALPWYAWVATETKAKFLEGFILNHNVGRFLEPMENHRGSPFYYLIVLILGTTPWSIFFALVGWYGFWSIFPVVSPRWSSYWKNAQEENRHPAYRFLLAWIGTFLLFFSLAATKLPNYILPVSVPFALLTARFLIRWCRGLVHPPVWALKVSLAFLWLVGLGTGLGLLLASGVWPIPGLRIPKFPGLEQGAVLGLLPLVGGVLGWWFLRCENRQGLVLTVTFTTLFFMAPLAAWANAALNSFKAPRPLVEQTHTGQPNQAIYIGCWQMEHLPSLNFYCQRDILHFQSTGEIQPFLRYPDPVYVFLHLDEWKKLKPKITVPYRELAQHRDLYRNRDIIVITNR